MSSTEIIYLDSIQEKLFQFVFDICSIEQRNSNKHLVNIVKVILFRKYVSIMEHYLSDDILGDLNFFTVTEAEDIMQRINDISKGYNWLNLV